MDDEYDSDDEKSQYQKIMESSHKVQRGMFVSGWDDDVVEEEKNPHETLEKEILWAANEGKINVIQEILKLDKECVHSTDDDGYTPLHRAAYNNFTEIAELLIKNGANINAKTNLGWTPLHSACKWNNAKMAAVLLQHGADVNAKSDGLQTPLHVCATVSNCRDTAMVLLMRNDIDADAKNNSDETAADIARRTGMTFPIFVMGHPAYKVNLSMLPPINELDL